MERLVKEFIQAAPIITTTQAEMVYQNIHNEWTPQEISIISPYISQDTIDELAKKQFKMRGIKGLSSFASYISQDTMDECAKEEFDRNGLEFLPVVAPFISQELIDNSAKEEHQLNGFIIYGSFY
ncbi:hypothetical protein [Thalassobacillus pellis]|uniref:hypothetical protein n=1 Tax=Thalassobacillus pellis TaxID=748008 RepID=UPI001960FC45|nr:hypothetical protein [Thalassobacillus pellis]MBM7553915.1 hypothetical protein [Thalassobacillus pellis]